MNYQEISSYVLLVATLKILSKIGILNLQGFKTIL